MIIKCSCKHEAQDKLHGKGNRVFNPSTKKQGTKSVYRCTVCNTEATKEGKDMLRKGQS